MWYMEDDMLSEESVGPGCGWWVGSSFTALCLPATENVCAKKLLFICS